MKESELILLLQSYVDGDLSKQEASMLANVVDFDDRRTQQIIHTLRQHRRLSAKVHGSCEHLFDDDASRFVARTCQAAAQADSSSHSYLRRLFVSNQRQWSATLLRRSAIAIGLLTVAVMYFFGTEAEKMDQGVTHNQYLAETFIPIEFEPHKGDTVSSVLRIADFTHNRVTRFQMKPPLAMDAH